MTSLLLILSSLDGDYDEMAAEPMPTGFKILAAVVLLLVVVGAVFYRIREARRSRP